MSIYITKDGEKRKVNISATDVQLLDIDGRFKNKNLEDALKELNPAGGTINHAETAGKLAKPILINDTSFDGTDNITTSKWGSSRNIKIGNTTKSIDGSSDISWSLSEIGASASSHTHDERYYTETEVNNLLSKKANKSDVLTSSTGTFTPQLLTNQGEYITIDGIQTGTYSRIGSLCFITISINGTYNSKTYGMNMAQLELPFTSVKNGIIPVAVGTETTITSPVVGITNGSNLMIVSSVNLAPNMWKGIFNSDNITIQLSGFFYC